jgi:hypothetical protein
MIFKNLMACVLLILLPRLLPAQQNIITAKPDTIQHVITVVNATPVSDIDVPIRIGLKPFYNWANAFIDTLYTSPNYPANWVQEGCDTRYQYHFVRGPFTCKTYNNLLYITFSGFYQLRGSTRICSNGVALSPWTPACSCGFGSEKPRRIDAGFVVKFWVKPDFSIGLTVQRTTPVPIDKCTVCFFGKDITETVSKQLAADLDSSIATMQRQMQSFSLKPYMKIMWDTLQAGYKIPGLGVVNFAPQQIRMSQLILRNDTLFTSMGLSARPTLDNHSSTITRTNLPALSDFSFRNGLGIFTKLHLPYDSLNTLINSQLAGTDINVGTGVFKKTIRIDSVRLLGGGSKLFIQVALSKGIKGTVYLEGKPNWDGSTQELRMDSLAYHLQSKQVLLRAANWMLNGVIERKIKAACRFKLAERIKTVQTMMTAIMNQTLYPGIVSVGYLNKLVLQNIVLNPEGIDLGAEMAGRLFIDIDGAAMMKQFMRK